MRSRRLKPYRGSDSSRHFFTFLTTGVGPGRQVGQRWAGASLIMTRRESSMLAQSNKLVGITLAGGGAGVHHRSSSPPISGALRSFTRAHTRVRACTYFTCARYIPRNLRPAPLASAASWYHESFEQPPIERPRPWFAKYRENLLDRRINEGRRATNFNVRSHGDHLSRLFVKWRLVRPIIGVRAAWGVAGVPRKLPARDSVPTSSESISPWRKSDKAFRRDFQSSIVNRVLCNKTINRTCT